MTFKNRINSWCQWRSMLRPITVLSGTFKVTNRVVVGRPG